MSGTPAAIRAPARDAAARRFTVFWLPVIGWTGCIVGLSSDAFSPEETSRWATWLVAWIDPEADPMVAWVLHRALRKLAHLGEYAVLGALLLRALRTTGHSAPVATAVAIAGLIALGDETRQWFTASRSASLLDCALDTVGATVGTWLWQRLATASAGEARGAKT